MRKWWTLLVLLFPCVMAYGENKIKMVTYFPIPYVAYSQINVTKQLDVGLTSACMMNLGCTESGTAGLRPLTVTNGILTNGRLNLNTATALLSSTADIGSGAGLAELNFGGNLRLGVLNNGYSMESTNTAVDNLQLFPSHITTDFPSCTGAPGAPQIAWRKLSLKGTEETFLMCGEGTIVKDCTDPEYKASNKAECCASAPTSDSVCYMNCNCRMEAHSNGSPSKVKEESATCTMVNGSCGWTYSYSYIRESGCASQMLSQYPNGGSGTCRWASQIYMGSNTPYCQYMYSSCIMSGGGTARPYYYIYDQSYAVSEVCDRCKNGW